MKKMISYFLQSSSAQLYVLARGFQMLSLLRMMYFLHRLKKKMSLCRLALFFFL